MAPLDMELDSCYNKLCPLQLEEILTIAIAFICFATDNIKCMYNNVHRKRRVLSILPTLGVLFVLWWEVLRILHHTVPGTKTSGLTTRRHLLCKSFKRISKSTISPRCTGLTCYVSTSLPHHNTNSISQAGVVRSFKIGHV